MPHKDAHAHKKNVLSFPRIKHIKSPVLPHHRLVPFAIYLLFGIARKDSYSGSIYMLYRRRLTILTFIFVVKFRGSHHALRRCSFWRNCLAHAPLHNGPVAISL